MEASQGRRGFVYRQVVVMLDPDIPEETASRLGL
jgi:hypothetical protein